MKRSMALLLILCFLVQLTGCKSQNSDIVHSNSKEETVQQEEKEEAEEEESDDTQIGEGTTTDISTATPTPVPTPTPAPTPTPTPPPVQAPSPDVEFGSSDVVEVEDVKEVEIPEIHTEVIVTTTHKALSSDKYYQYSALTTQEKKIYSAVYDGAKQCQTYIELKSYGCNKDTLNKVYHAVIGDHPELFYLTNLYAYSTLGQNVQKLILFYLDGTNVDTLENGEVKANANRNKIAQQIEKFNEQISEILKKIPTSASEIQKEKMIYDYLQDSITYDTVSAALVYGSTSISTHAFDAYGAACERKAVCEGYAELFQYLCYCVGMNATQVYGTAKGGSHMWNTVCVDSDWYMLDATWDDCGTEGVHYYTYFNLTTSEMSGLEHAVNDAEIKVPVCTSKKHAFYKDFALYVDNLSKAPSNYRDVIDYAVANKEISICIYGEASSTEMQKYINSYIFSPKSEVQKYIKSKGYNMTFNSQYYIMGNYYYIRIK